MTRLLAALLLALAGCLAQAAAAQPAAAAAQAAEGSKILVMPKMPASHYRPGARYSGPETVQITVPLDRYPVFVRAGAVIPTQESDRLVLSAWAGARGAFDLYDDQGQGLAYRRGAFARTRISTDGRSRVTIGRARGTFAGAPARRAWRVRFVGFTAPGAVTTVDTGARSTRRATTVRVRQGP